MRRAFAHLALLSGASAYVLAIVAIAYWLGALAAALVMICGGVLAIAINGSSSDRGVT